MKIIAFGASNSKKSINKEFAGYAASQFESAEAEIIDINMYELPLYSLEREQELGHPVIARKFVEKLAEADLLIISLAEHNGSYTTAFKNLFDWASRVKLKMFEGKKMLLLSAATGPGGGRAVMESAGNRFPKHGAEIVARFSLPNFNDNFSVEAGLINPDLRAQFAEIIESVKSNLVGNTMLQ